MARIAHEGAAVGQHTDEAAKQAHVGQRLHLIDHAVALIVEPPAAAHLDLAGHAALEVAQHGRDDVVVAAVERIEDGLAQPAGHLDLVEQRGEVLGDQTVAHGVIAGIGAVLSDGQRVVVADGVHVHLHRPAALGVHAAQAHQSGGLERALLIMRAGRAGDGLFEHRVQLGGGRVARGHIVHAVVADARADGVEEVQPLLERGHEILKGGDGHTGGRGELLDIRAVAGLGDVQRRVGAEGGQHLDLEGRILGQRDVIVQVGGGIVGGADDLDVELFDQAAAAELVGGEHGVGAVPDRLGGLFIQHVVDAEHALKLQMRPVIERVADGVFQHGGVGVELVPVRAAALVAVQERLVRAVGQHGAPLVVIAAQHQMADVAIVDVVDDFVHLQMAVIVIDGHIFGIIVEQRARGFGAEQKILVHKRFHGAVLLLAVDEIGGYLYNTGRSTASTTSAMRTKPRLVGWQPSTVQSSRSWLPKNDSPLMNHTFLSPFSSAWA